MFNGFLDFFVRKLEAFHGFLEYLARVLGRF